MRFLGGLTSVVILASLSFLLPALSGVGTAGPITSACANAQFADPKVRAAEDQLTKAYNQYGIGSPQYNAAEANREKVIANFRATSPACAGGETGGGPPAPTPAPSPCARPLFIGLRGSGEQITKQNNGMGDLVNSVYAGIAGSNPLDIVDPVKQKQYVALPVKLAPSFASSSWTGTNLVLSEVRLRRTACGPSSRVVLAGYSQGAMAIIDALQDMSKAERASVAGVALFGNPYYTPFVNGAVGPRNAPGILGFSAPLPDGLPNRMQDYCNAHDPVCSAPGGVIPNLYYIWQCGDKQATCTHFQYARIPEGDTSRDKAVAYLTGRLRG